MFGAFSLVEIVNNEFKNIVVEMRYHISSLDAIFG
jgi:hypothetical protein